MKTANTTYKEFIAKAIKKNDAGLTSGAEALESIRAYETALIDLGQADDFTRLLTTLALNIFAGTEGQRAHAEPYILGNATIQSLIY